MPDQEDAPEAPPFLDFYPADIDGALSLLLAVSTPGSPQREAAPAGTLSPMRLAVLATLEQQQARWRACGHEVAERIVRTAAVEGRPFGLYLRNFVLGATAQPGGRDERGSQRVMTFVSPTDTRMQSWLGERAGAKVPFVSVANRAAVLGSLPRFELSNQDWQAGAGTLIEHAGATVLFFLTRTPGVAAEIDMLRAAGAQERTLVIVQDDDPRDDRFSRVMLELFGEGVEPAVDPSSVPEPALRLPPDDFPFRVHVDESSDEPGDALRAALDELLGRARPPRSGELPPLPPPDGPSADALTMARQLSLAWYEEGIRDFQHGDAVAAEDAAVRSIVFSHWARDPLGRGIGLSLLAGVERQLLGQPNEAVGAYFLALDVLDPLQSSSADAREVFPSLVDQVATYLEELGDLQRAKLVRNRLQPASSTGGGEA